MLFPGNNDYTGRHAGDIDLRRSPFRFLIPVLVTLLLLFLLSWPVLETYMLEVEAVTLRSASFPAAAGQLRIVYLADIHKGGLFNDARVASLVSRINALEPDVVLLGGDYADDSAGAIQFFRTMPRIHARYGVFAVPGNHDRTVPESNLNQLRSAMQEASVTPLINTVTHVRIGASNIYIAGLDDVNCGHPDLTGVASQVRKNDYVILLCHSPAIIPQALSARDADFQQGWFDLGLFGHTHGGQVSLFGGLVQDDTVEDAYFSGWKRVNRTDLLTSRGVGTSVLPIRLFCRPQIHLITLMPLT
ncbi:MAG: metallophosphoesterase [Clostridia bacterium]|nr:metallophosphoesterase [Clostridia bacterium]